MTTGNRRFGPLHGAVADAKAFQAVFEKLGFELALLTDATARR